MDSDQADLKFTVGTVIGLSAAELANSLKNHVFVVSLAGRNQRVHVRITGKVLPSGNMESVVVVPNAPAPRA